MSDPHRLSVDADGDSLAIPATLMRGGTSKGVFFAADDLPPGLMQRPSARDALLLRVIGSPDPYGRHTDGLGGATSSTSKVVIVSRSLREDCDVEFLFGAVAIESPLIDYPRRTGGRAGLIPGRRGALRLAVAAALPGTIVAEVARTLPGVPTRIGHVSGVLAVGAVLEQRDGRWHVDRAVMSRSARRLMEGTVFAMPGATRA